MKQLSPSVIKQPNPHSYRARGGNALSASLRGLQTFQMTLFNRDLFPWEEAGVQPCSAGQQVRAAEPGVRLWDGWHPSALAALCPPSRDQPRGGDELHAGFSVLKQKGNALLSHQILPTTSDERTPAGLLLTNTGWNNPNNTSILQP